MYRNFRIQCILRIVSLSATMGGALWLALWTQSYVAAGLVGFIAVYQGVALVRYVEKTNHDLSRLLRSIRYSDFSQSFTPQGRGGSFAELAAAFRAVMDDFRAARAEKEESYRYLETVMHHIGIGLVSFNREGEVNLINTAAKRLLRVPYLKNIAALATFSPDLVDRLFEMRAGEKALVKIADHDELLQLVIYATQFRMREEGYTLVSIQNIQSELEEMEIEAWQKLTRVLTHEIMNSVAPIASLAATANELLDEAAMGSNGTTRLDLDTIDDVHGAVRTIERRSEGLLGFVNAYRKLTRVPKPDFRIYPIAQLFSDLEELMRPQMEQAGIRFITSFKPETLTVTADPKLIEQVLINLLRNALQATEGVPKAEVRLEAAIDRRGHTSIQIIDNGRGIVPEALDKIFIPFFTTKSDGSGIGLSLSREIMRQHGGSLSAASQPGQRTVFTMRF